ncbi:hypothetical protein COOONC_15165, partial [Cooperia oncophora]
MLNAAIEESQLLKNIAEKQVEEALLAAQQEREQRLAMKKELDAVKNAEHLSSLTDMLMGLERLGEDAMIQVSDQLFQFYAQIVQNQGQNTEKSVIEIVNKLRQLARENAEDLPKVSLADEGVESGADMDASGTKAIPLNSDRA